MDTQTEKQEVLKQLEALESDKLSYTQRIMVRNSVNAHTARQAGYEAEITTSGWLLNAPRGGIENRNVYPFETSAWEDGSPEFANSVDACLTLKLPDNIELVLYPLWGVEIHITGGYLSGGVTPIEAKPLSIAYLKAWWSIQS